jgi:glycosyltransferase involved in cell wall biosynthesis
MLEVSVIVPVYNAERFLQKCIDSIFLQGGALLEIILVYDDSEDDSAALCERFASEHENITAIHQQENRSLGGARNAGMEVAQGEYLFFVDADDFLAPNRLNEMYLCCKKFDLDMLASSVFWIDEDGNILRFTASLSLDEDTVTSGIAYIKNYGCNYMAMVYSYMHKKAFLDAHHIQFPENIYSEDEWFTFQCLAFAKRIIFHNYEHYFYVQHPTSITGSFSKKRGLDVLCVAERVISFVKAHNYDQHTSKSILSYASSTANYLFRPSIPNKPYYKGLLSPTDRKRFIAALKYRKKYALIRLALFLHLENLYNKVFEAIWRHKA